MKNSLEAVKKAGIIPRLSLAEQIIDEEGNKKGVRGTGFHKVKLIEDKIIMGRDYHSGEERYEMHYIVEEDGIRKYYPTALKGEDGQLSYLVKKMSEYQEGDEVMMEYKKRGAAGYIDVWKPKDMEKIEERKSAKTVEKGEKKQTEIPVVEDEGTIGKPPF